MCVCEHKCRHIANGLSTWYVRDGFKLSVNGKYITAESNIWTRFAWPPTIIGICDYDYDQYIYIRQCQKTFKLIHGRSLNPISKNCEQGRMVRERGISMKKREKEKSCKLNLLQMKTKTRAEVELISLFVILGDTHTHKVNTHFHFVVISAILVWRQTHKSN